MLKKSILAACFSLVLAVAANAQGGFQRRTVEERVQTVHQKIDSAFKPSAEVLTKVDAAFKTYYTEQDKIMAESRGEGQRPDMDALRKKMEPLIEARDKELKAVLTEDQFKKFKDEIEPSLRQRRPGGGNERRRDG
ncbi:MAG: hypothetical protein ABS85_03470 [Sphingobacteriales bacterium SCN 48-20]|jgi:protein CpxP|uniref:hypothetical protein n=1 Tax=Terrimonas ferruginea TaxID=249 RepID=UPI00086C5408|nr:hypothetical protein [Terrimonas ferruginea]MBN8785356.1 hypothetical protein [Terrimonas ferruginea]ODT94345.1 MAG: hypothetical protein ABS85_03470 [Sphingobacteriales bacterium SCN 48-20]OJW44445.1 MAG: hypothetical protein BGO56_07275 [Sphingobacteriales bacterium 48-107]